MMSLDDFRKTIDWLEHITFFQIPEKRKVSIMGGEPTIHPKLKDMIKILKERNIKAMMFSNFIFNKKKFDIFDKEVIKGFVGTYNPKKDYKKKEYEIIDYNIKELKKKGFDVKLSYNITKDNLDYKYILDACKRYKLENLRFSTAFPNPNYNNNYMNFEDLKKSGMQIMSFVRDAIAQGLKLDLDCTIPLCLLGGTPNKPADKEILFFLKHVNTKHLICESAMDINPDLSINYCLPRANDANVKNLLEFDNFKEMNKLFDQQSQLERNELYTFRECKSCKYQIRKVCQGGCLSVKKKFSYNAKEINKKQKRTIIGVKTWGGIGDGLLVTPSFKALKEKYPDSELRVLCNKNHEEIYTNNPYIDFLSVYPNESSFNKIKLDKLYETNYGKLKPTINCNEHATHIIADLLDVKLKYDKLQIFLTDNEDTKAKRIMSNYNNPIVIHTTSKCTNNKDWPDEKWNELVKQMSEFTFIQVGLRDETLITGAIDKRGNSIIETIALIKHAKCFVGVESGFGHTTNAFNTKGVVLFGPSNPIIFGHENNINLYKDIECSPCVDTLGNKKCPYDKKCIKLITIKEVEKAILKLTNKKKRNIQKKKGFFKNIIR